VVFLIFGIGKFRNDIWAQTIRGMDIFQALPWDPNLSVAAIGVLEVAVAVGLILGLFTRVCAALAAVQLLGILILLEFQQVRDIGLLAAAVQLALTGDDAPGLGRILRRGRKRTPANEEN
jgi:uncharacterized membrane protein YphA (DoxX/SURF4 family)